MTFNTVSPPRMTRKQYALFVAGFARWRWFRLWVGGKWCRRNVGLALGSLIWMQCAVPCACWIVADAAGRPLISEDHRFSARVLK